MNRRVGSLALAAALASTFLLTGCGSADSETASDPANDATTGASSAASESASGAPSGTDAPTEVPTTSGGMAECDALWVDGQTLPRKYKGCLRDGVVVKAVKKPCGFGLPLVEFDNRFYAMPGGPINDVGDLATSPDYQSALSSCQA